MLVRYGTSVNGKPYIKAKIYTSDEHQIDKNLVDHDAVHVVRVLQKHGFQAYIVGGAVRDLLLHRKPKDFDIATDAQPRRIRGLFGNSRIIGKRFRLVHIHFRGDKVIEVSTFRADSAEENVFGTIEEDVRRRDFTFNGLYFCPVKKKVFDYCNGFEHIQKRKLVPILDPKTMFVDDPVRMIRAVKYSVSTGFKIPLSISMRIKKEWPLLKNISISRLTEEVLKIISGGLMEPILKRLFELKLLSVMLPVHCRFYVRKDYRTDFTRIVKEHDLQVQASETGSKSLGFLALTRIYAENKADMSLKTDELWKQVFSLMKEFIRPLTPPNVFLEKACTDFINEKRPKRTSRHGRSKARTAKSKVD